MSLIDITKVQEEAEAELRTERETAAKKQIKTKMKQIADSKVVTANLQRELDDLLHTIGEGNGE